MKFVSYAMGHGAHFGLVRDGGVIDLTPRVGNRYPDLRSFIAAPDWRGICEALLASAPPDADYDGLMLQLHDRMKADASFQATCEQERVDFPSGSTWIAFTDEVSHAAMAGQYQFEQTFLLPVSAMIDESRSPLRILERLKGRRLA